MKRLLFLLFLLLLAPVPALALVGPLVTPALEVIQAGRIGVNILTIAQTKIALVESTQPNYGLIGNMLTRPMWTWSPVQLVTGMAAVGYQFPGMLDLKPAYDSGAIKNDPVLGPIAQGALGGGNGPQPGDVLMETDLPHYSDPNLVRTPSGEAPVLLKITAGPSVTTNKCWSATTGHSLSLNPAPTAGIYTYIQSRQPNPNGICNGNDMDVTQVTYWVVRATGVPTYSVALPGELSPEDAQKLADALAAAAAQNAQVANALDDLIRQFPGMITNAQQIAQSALENFMKEYAQKAQQDAIKAAEDALAADPTNAALKAALEALKAQIAQDERDQQAKEKDETFGSIPADGFDTPYNPGEYDIPGRFSAFMNNVKSSPLFSFSSGFFNSLPGGGSPIYTIEGGSTFGGTYTVDLSQTMTNALAVLKTIMLAIFGFLSIRAIIMKR